MPDDVTKELLSRAIAYHALIAKATGSADLAIIWQQIKYWSERTTNPDGWVYKTRDDMYLETGLRRRAQDGARRLGARLGVLESRRMGRPCTVHFRVNVDRMAEILGRFVGGQGQLFESAPAASPARQEKLFITAGAEERCAECFEVFWRGYPRKENKKGARQRWMRLDHSLHERIIADVAARAAGHDTWIRGFVPHAASYLNQERWNDEIVAPKGKPAAVVPNDEQKEKLKSLSQ